MTLEHDQNLLLTWQLAPILLLDNAEVFQNMRVSSGGGEEDLNEDYLRLREELWNSRLVIVGVQGPSKTGKGGFLMGLRRLFRQDEYLRAQLEEEGIELQEYSIPFAHCMEAAKLPQVGLVPPQYNPATYGWEHVRAGSNLQWQLAQELLPEGAVDAEEISRRLKDQKKAITIFIEASAPLCYPVSGQVPVEVEGIQDLGNSTLYNLALDSKTRPFVTLYMLDAAQRVKEDRDSMAFREHLSDPTADLDTIYRGTNTRVIAVDQSSGEESAAESLSENTKRQLANLLKKSMATPAGVVRINQELDELLRGLYIRGMVPDTNLRSYYEFLRGKLSLPEDKLRILTNPWLEGTKSYDTGYLLGSYVVQRYPNLLS